MQWVVGEISLCVKAKCSKKGGSFALCTEHADSQCREFTL
nr:MAG TPA: hypothetical protein [Caudoviricetes sp.]